MLDKKSRREDGSPEFAKPDQGFPVLKLEKSALQSKDHKKKRPSESNCYRNRQRKR